MSTPLSSYSGAGGSPSVRIGSCTVTSYRKSNGQNRRPQRKNGRVALCYLEIVSQPVKLSDSLVLEARLAGKIVERSIAGQVEFWARLGRSVELLLDGQHVMALCRNAEALPLSEAIDSVDTAEGRRRLQAYLQSQPFPHYEPHPVRRGLLVRIDADGSRTVGRFVNRRFRAVRDAAGSRSKTK